MSVAAVTGLAALAAAVTLAVVAWESFPETITAVGDFFAGVFEGVKAVLGDVAAFAAGVLSSAFDGLMVVLGHVWSTLKAVGGYFQTAFGPASAAAIDSLVDAFRTMGSVFGETWSAIVSLAKAGEFKGAVQAAWIGVQAAWKAGVLGLDIAWEKFKINFKDGARQAANDAAHDLISFAARTARLFVDIGDTIGVVFDGVVKSISDAIADSLSVMAGFGKKLAGFLPSFSPQAIALKAAADQADAAGDQTRDNAQKKFDQQTSVIAPDTFADRAARAFAAKGGGQIEGTKDLIDAVAAGLENLADEQFAVNRQASQKQLDALDQMLKAGLEGIREEAAAGLAEVTDRLPKAPEQGPAPRLIAELGPMPRLVKAAQFGVAAAGTFSGRNISQSLGIGGSVSEKIAANTKKGADETEKLREEFKKFNENRLRFD